MNDSQIRSGLHRKLLRRHHAARDTLVVDELGLKHGQGRADIAVINGRLMGYEIKSDDDSLRRLPGQIENYAAVFDRVTVVVEPPHLRDIESIVPCWWGIVAASEGPRGAVHFKTLRRARPNPGVDDYAVAHLLWRNEAEQELEKRGFAQRARRRSRSVLYRDLISVLTSSELRRVVRQCLANRRDWRCPWQPSPGDGSSPPFARH